MASGQVSSKASTLGEMQEGPAAFDRFKAAMKRILTVPKSVVTKDREQAAKAKQKPASGRPRK